MKKIVIMCCFLLTGCFNNVGGTKETVDTINDQKLAAAKLSVNNVLSVISQKYLLEADKFSKNDDYYCIKVTSLEVSNKFTNGVACINNSGQTKAVDIVYDSYICNGISTSLECEKIDK